MTPNLHNDVVLDAGEGTHLFTSASSSVTYATSNNLTTASTREHAAINILHSTTLSRLGSRTWEFATPLLLLEWSPGSLAAPASLGLTCALFRTIVSPWLGKLADEWDRMSTVWIGTSMQAAGCLMSVGALVLFNFSTSKMNGDDGGKLIHLLSLVLVITAGVIEALGAQLSSVAVKKEWLPIMFDEEATNILVTVAEKKKKSTTLLSLLDILPSPITLSFINTTMTNIDLLSAMFGPVLAGWVLEALAFKDSSMQRGFVLIALMNVISLAPEMYLLRKVYLSCSALQLRRGDSIDECKQSGESTSRNDSSNEEDRNPWILFINHPSGLPLLTISLASLYMTALSPAGVVLTSYLMTIGLSPTSIGAFRGFGAISGVVGIYFFSLLRKKEANESGERSTVAKSIERLRGLSLAFLLLEVVSILVAAAAYKNLRDETLTTSSVFDKSGEPMSWQIYLFLGAIVVSRAGLYSFDVGVLEIEQYIVDERYRNAVGSVEGALCSLCEMGMYVLSIALPNPSQFGWQVGVSASAVSFGGVCFGMFLCLYHMHLHQHGEDDHHAHNHSHGHHHHHHRHTLQQERDLKEFGYHIHLHRHGKSWR
ncbi:hypothetical protein ACHAXM_009530 [Skeletonema potamos]|jgi:hypothetical protein